MRPLGRPLGKPVRLPERKSIERAFAPSVSHNGVALFSSADGRDHSRGIHTFSTNVGLLRLYAVAFQMGYTWAYCNIERRYYFLFGQQIRGEGATGAECALDVALYLEVEYGLAPSTALTGKARLNSVCAQLDLAWSSQEAVSYGSLKGPGVVFLIGRLIQPKQHAYEDGEQLFHDIANQLEESLRD